MLLMGAPATHSTDANNVLHHSFLRMVFVKFHSALRHPNPNVLTVLVDTDSHLLVGVTDTLLTVPNTLMTSVRAVFPGII